MSKEILTHPVIQEIVDRGRVPLSLATRGGGLIFVGGLPPLNLDTGELVTGNIEEQTTASLNAIKTVLEANGSGMSKIMKTTVFAVNAGMFDRVNDAYREFFPSEPPARTFVTVGSWPWPFDIEIEAIALA